jgi:hypothetical protein
MKSTLPGWTCAALAALALSVAGCGTDDGASGSAGGAAKKNVDGAPASAPSWSAEPTSRPAPPESQPTSASAPAAEAKAAASRPAPEDPRAATCKATVEALRGGLPLTPEQSTIFASGRMGPAVNDAVTCLAVAHRDNRRCGALAGEKKERCGRAVAYYRWARAPTGDRAWFCDDQARKKAGKKGISATDFQSMCDAVRTGDPSKCPKAGTEEGDGCRAEASLDPANCRGRPLCLAEVERSKRIVAGGLAARLSTATGAERIQIEAALKGAEACAGALQALRQSCQVSDKSDRAGKPERPKAPTRGSR